MTGYAQWLKSLWNTEESSTLMIQWVHSHKQGGNHSQGISISQGRQIPPRSSTKNSVGKSREVVKWSTTEEQWNEVPQIFTPALWCCPNLQDLGTPSAEDSKSSSIPCFELHEIQKIGNSQVTFPVTHSTGIQRIMTTDSNKHSMLQKLNRKHSAFSHSYDSLGFTSSGPRFRPKLWWETRNVLKALSPVVNTKDVYMKRCCCSRRCPWAFAQCRTVPSLLLSPC